MSEKKQASKWEAILDALTHFKQYFYRVIEKTKDENTAFTNNIVEKIKLHDKKQNRSARRFIRYDLEMKIKELYALHHRINQEFEEIMEVIREVEHTKHEQTSNLNAFVMKANPLVEKIDKQMNHFTNEIISPLIDVLNKLLVKLEHQNKVHANFTRVHSPRFLANSYKSPATVKVGNRGSLSSLRTSHERRRSMNKKNNTKNNTTKKNTD